jgi:hypothetical protein
MVTMRNAVNAVRSFVGLGLRDETTARLGRLLR